MMKKLYLSLSLSILLSSTYASEFVTFDKTTNNEWRMVSHLPIENVKFKFYTKKKQDDEIYQYMMGTNFDKKTVKIGKNSITLTIKGEAFSIEILSRSKIFYHLNNINEDMMKKCQIKVDFSAGKSLSSILFKAGFYKKNKFLLIEELKDDLTFSWSSRGNNLCTFSSSEPMPFSSIQFSDLKINQDSSTKKHSRTLYAIDEDALPSDHVGLINLIKAFGTKGGKKYHSALHSTDSESANFHEYTIYLSPDIFTQEKKVQPTHLKAYGFGAFRNPGVTTIFKRDILTGKGYSNKAQNSSNKPASSHSDQEASAYQPFIQIAQTVFESSQFLNTGSSNSPLINNSNPDEDIDGEALTDREWQEIMFINETMPQYVSGQRIDRQSTPNLPHGLYVIQTPETRNACTLYSFYAGMAPVQKATIFEMDGKVIRKMAANDIRNAVDRINDQTLVGNNDLIYKIIQLRMGNTTGNTLNWDALKGKTVRELKGIIGKIINSIETGADFEHVGILAILGHIYNVNINVYSQQNVDAYPLPAPENNSTRTLSIYHHNFLLNLAGPLNHFSLVLEQSPLEENNNNVPAESSQIPLISNQILSEENESLGINLSQSPSNYDQMKDQQTKNDSQQSTDENLSPLSAKEAFKAAKKAIKVIKKRGANDQEHQVVLNAINNALKFSHLDKDKAYLFYKKALHLSFLNLNHEQNQIILDAINEALTFIQPDKIKSFLLYQKVFYLLFLKPKENQLGVIDEALKFSHSPAKEAYLLYHRVFYLSKIDQKQNQIILNAINEALKFSYPPEKKAYLLLRKFYNLTRLKKDIGTTVEAANEVLKYQKYLEAKDIVHIKSQKFLKQSFLKNLSKEDCEEIIEEIKKIELEFTLNPKTKKLLQERKEVIRKKIYPLMQESGRVNGCRNPKRTTYESRVENNSPNKRHENSHTRERANDNRVVGGNHHFSNDINQNREQRTEGNRNFYRKRPASNRSYHQGNNEDSN